MNERRPARQFGAGGDGSFLENRDWSVVQASLVENALSMSKIAMFSMMSSKTIPILEIIAGIELERLGVANRRAAFESAHRTSRGAAACGRVNRLKKPRRLN